MRPKPLAGTLVERRQSVSTASRAHGVLPHPPDAFARVEGRSAAYKGRFFEK